MPPHIGNIMDHNAAETPAKRVVDRRFCTAPSLDEAMRMARSAPTVDPRTGGILLGIGDAGAYAAARRGDFGGFRVGGRYRFQSRLILAAIGESVPAPEAA